MKYRLFVVPVLILFSVTVFVAATEVANNKSSIVTQDSLTKIAGEEIDKIPREDGGEPKSSQFLISERSATKFLSPTGDELAKRLLLAFTTPNKENIEQAKKALQEKYTDIDLNKALDYYKFDFELQSRVESWKNELELGDANRLTSDNEFIISAAFKIKGANKKDVLDRYIPRLEQLSNKVLAQFQIAKMCMSHQIGCAELEKISPKITDPKVKVTIALHLYRVGDKDKSLEMLSEVADQGVINSLDRFYFEAFDEILTEGDRSLLHYQQYFKLYISLLDHVYANLYSVCRQNWNSKNWLDACYKIGWGLFESGDRNGQPILADGLQYRPRLEHQSASDKFLGIQRRYQEIDREFGACGSIISRLKNPKISDKQWSIFLTDLEKKGFFEANVTLCKSLIF